jgi:hypothetical protein
MSSHARQFVQKLRNYCNVLRDDGLSHGDQVRQGVAFRGSSLTACDTQ